MSHDARERFQKAYAFANWLDAETDRIFGRPDEHGHRHGVIVLRAMREESPMDAAPVSALPQPIVFVYTNHRGETRLRVARHEKPTALWWGATGWHPRAQWLLSLRDLDTLEERDFALAAMDFRPQAVVPAACIRLQTVAFVEYGERERALLPLIMEWLARGGFLPASYGIGTHRTLAVWRAMVAAPQEPARDIVQRVLTFSGCDLR